MDRLIFMEMNRPCFFRQLQRKAEETARNSFEYCGPPFRILAS